MKTVLNAMKTSISEVMETMFFLPVEFFEEPAKNFIAAMLEKSNKVCRIDFKGDNSGSVFLMVPPKLLAEMTENFMGEPGCSLNDEILDGTLMESVNMITGNALRKLGAKIPFELSIPKIVPGSQFPETQGTLIVETIGSKMAVHIIFR